MESPQAHLHYVEMEPIASACIAAAHVLTMEASRSGFSNMDHISKLYWPATILIGCLILGSFYYVTEIRKQAAIDNPPAVLQAQKKQQIAPSIQSSNTVTKNQWDENLANLRSQCADRANRFFTSNLAGEYGKSPNYTNHYSSSMGKCYIEITLTGPQYWAVELYDATEGGMIAMVNYNYDPSTGEIGTLRQCFIGRLDNKCSSLAEFTRLTSTYMND
jgi:hypothetical protein